MKQKHTLPIMIGVLIVSAALITGLAVTNMTDDRKNKSMLHAQKLDINDDGAISLNELTASQDSRFTQLDRDKNGMIEKLEFNARLITMFQRMDRDGDGLLQVDDLPGYRDDRNKHQYSDDILGHTKAVDALKDTI